MRATIHDTLQYNNKPLPLVSVIIPMSKNADCSDYCIQSVIGQTYPEWELLCVYYDEDPHIPESLKSQEAEEPRIRVIASETTDCSIACRDAFRLTNGEYVIFVKPEDAIEDVTLDLAVTSAENNDSDIVVFDWRYYSAKKKTNKYKNGEEFFSYDVLEGANCSRILEASLIFIGNKLYRKEIIGKAEDCFEDENIFNSERFLSRILSNVNKISCIASPLYIMTEEEQQTDTDKVPKKKKKSLLGRIKRKLGRMLKSIVRGNNTNSKPAETEIILFMGFDNRYTGNSRYLFEELTENNTSKRQIFFATNDVRVQDVYRLEPDSEEFKAAFAKAKVVIFESWTPARYKKKKGTTWIQLWHGTPIKKMLFDSSEKTINLLKPHHKNRLYADIQKWDYLLADCPNAVSYFHTCFLIDSNRILPFGYPRVKYLIENNTADIKRSLRKSLDIPEEKKVVLYMPTWRDYNYGVDQTDFDLSYLVDLNKLQEQLGDEYFVVYKDHPYLSRPDLVNFKNYSSVETQELLLLADCLLTDYSSVMFDAFAIDMPVLLYCNDFEKNEDARGVYPSIWESVSYYCCRDEKEIALRFNDYEIEEHYEAVKSSYSYNPSGESFVAFIDQL